MSKSNIITLEEDKKVLPFILPEVEVTEVEKFIKTLESSMEPHAGTDPASLVYKTRASP